MTSYTVHNTQSWRIYLLYLLQFTLLACFRTHTERTLPAYLTGSNQRPCLKGSIVIIHADVFYRPHAGHSHAELALILSNLHVWRSDKSTTVEWSYSRACRYLCRLCEVFGKFSLTLLISNLSLRIWFQSLAMMQYDFLPNFGRNPPPSQLQSEDKLLNLC